ncbi:uncharacterized protein LOC127877482 isoform X2 [Dreissena polymorpha]|uniref:uncharacterized protein LOC127877482 isoform X2 n=1 Tax=Dreissena polymorpha TaxID=45954 RepID=UPI0022641B88|nr:uncharacterized protein LOC127877482 isoform X2 [Dreissena polymorpha]
MAKVDIWIILLTSFHVLSDGKTTAQHGQHGHTTDGNMDNTTPSISMTTVYRDCNDSIPNCEVLNETLLICKDIRNAMKLCQKFCILCNVVNGGWAHWGNFSTCDVTCGNGTQLRTRECSSPKPENGGLQCDGPANETVPCNLGLCPVHGGWSEWENWGSCSVTCGAGLRRRDRNCDNPFPSVDGHHCFGESINYEICNEPSCNHLVSTEVPVVMFSARNLSNTSLHSNESAIYIHIETNDGGGYNNVTGKFTAPVSGLYTFTVQYCVKARTVGNLELVQNGNPLQRGEIVGAEYAQCASLQALSKVPKGDRVWVRCTNDSEFYQDDPYRWATFSGALVHRYFSESVSGQIFVG